MNTENKGKLIGMVVAIGAMFIMLFLPNLIVFAFGIIITILYYFFILNEEEKRKSRYFLLSFIMVAGFIFSSLASHEISMMEHQGNVYYESSSTIFSRAGLDESSFENQSPAQIKPTVSYYVYSYLPQ